MWWHIYDFEYVFEKVKRRGGTVNKTSAYSEAAIQRVS